MSRYHHALLIFTSVASSIPLHGQEWTPRAPLGGTERAEAAAFSLDGKGYIVSGTEFPDNNAEVSDMWVYDPGADAWTPRASLPTLGRMGAVGFSLGSKGYVCAGTNQQNALLMNDLWEYDPANDSWTQKASLPASGRTGPAAFTVGDYAYVTMGVIYSQYCFNDVWRYDPANDSWMQMAPFPGIARYRPVAFTVNGKGYLGMGENDSLSMTFHDLWEYDPVMDTWTEKAALGSVNRRDAVGFSLGDKGYVGLGRDPNAVMMDDFWRYDPALDTWTAVDDFGGGARMSSVAFTIGLIAYVGTGWIPPFDVVNDIWAYHASIAQGISGTTATATGQLALYPQPANDLLHFTSADAAQVEVFDNVGKLVLNTAVPAGAYALPIASLAPGQYTMVLLSATAMERTQFVKW